jgi:hypothetical protein
MGAVLAKAMSPTIIHCTGSIWVRAAGNGWRGGGSIGGSRHCSCRDNGGGAVLRMRSLLTLVKWAVKLGMVHSLSGRSRHYSAAVVNTPVFSKMGRVSRMAAASVIGLFSAMA